MSEPRSPEAPERESFFERTADYVSAAMGRPTNIVVWLVLVIAWTAMGPYLAQHPFLPAWSVSTGWNFPLNLITTVAELFIGFLVAAASNRSERNLHRTLAAIGAQEARIGAVEDRLAAELAQDVELTQAVKRDTALLDEIHRHVTALAPDAGKFPPAADGPVSGGAGDNPAGAGLPADGPVVPPPAAPKPAGM